MNSSTDPHDRKAISAIDFQPSIDHIDDGYTLCEKDSLTVVYSNSTFLKWFDSTELQMPIANVIASLKTDVLLKRLDKRGCYLLVLESDEKEWGFPQRIEISFKQLNEGNKEYVSLHARDMTKLLEKEAQLFGHARIIENNNSGLSRLNKELQAENNRLSAEVKEARK
ncbi:MAG: hypothetical protein ABGX33_04455 [Cycloclasticus sp.]